jgi:hypothetical protein
MDDTRKALFMCASHCQGGHSDAGAAAAKVLGIPFPIRMDTLVERAEAEGADPHELWPWLKTLRTAKAHY